MFSSGPLWQGSNLLYFKEREDFTYTNYESVMPIMGMRLNGQGHFVIATGMYLDFVAHYEVINNTYKLSARFNLDGDQPYEDVSVNIYNIPDGTYNEMAHIYREYQIKERGLRPLKEKIKERPALKYVAESIEVRIRQAWKPAPSPILHQSPDNEPPLKVVCDFDRVSEIIDRMKQAGIEKAEICLVGWNRGGHDGRFPQLFPAEPALGGDEKLKALNKKAVDNGYMIVCHDNYTAAYECAECWDEEFVVRNKENKMASFMPEGSSLSGGRCYRLCPRRAYERFATNRLPRMRDFGFKGLHFVDVFTARGPAKCYDSRHPVNMADCRDYYLKIMKLSKETVGGFQSEGPYDYLAPELDYCMYTSGAVAVDESKRETYPISDEMFPLWELVYHGYILSNPTTQTVNYTIKEKDKEVTLAEREGRPLMYIYSKFGATMNWMGNDDLRCETEEELSKTISELAKANEFLKKYGWLQYETMERYEKIADKVYCTTYSDGTKVVVDYSNNTYEVTRNN